MHITQIRLEYKSHERLSLTLNLAKPYMNVLPTLNTAACGDPSSMKGGLLVAISTTVHPKDQMSAGAP